jgi:hypothetical protein
MPRVKHIKAPADKYFFIHIQLFLFYNCLCQAQEYNKVVSDIKLTEKASGVKLGIYKHYKGGSYQVLGVGIHSETLEEYVIYKALYGQGLTWLRPLSMFLEEVEVKGLPQRRFKFVSKNL